MKNLTTGNDDSRATLVRIGILVAIASMVATVVWLGGRSRADDSGTSDTTGGDNSSQTVENASVKQVAPEAAPADGVVIPTAADQVDGYPTGFPATDLGAVALQVEVAKAQLGFDYAASRPASRRRATCPHPRRTPSPRSPTPSSSWTPATTR